jgi:hypothetical protein
VSIESGAISQCLTKSLDDWWAKGQVWYKISIHDIKVEPIKASINGFLASASKVGKVSG